MNEREEYYETRFIESVIFVCISAYYLRLILYSFIQKREKKVKCQDQDKDQIKMMTNKNQQFGYYILYPRIII